MDAPLIVICGPTASGKSAVAVELSKQIGGEVVSCDSMQLYRGMNVGTATPDAAEMGGVRHHLIDVLNPSEPCSAAAYREMALPVIADIRARGKTAVLCGGTGLYINALTKPLGFALPGDEALRAELSAIADAPNGRRMLHDRLREVDPDSADRLHENDVRRVIRALEIYRLTGKTQTEQAAIDSARSGDFVGALFAPDWPRDVLYARIDERVDRMVGMGLVDEVEALIARGVSPTATAMQAIGYKEIVRALDGAWTMNEAIDRIKQSTRRYAKRQLTWFRGDARTTWIAAEGKSAAAIAREIIMRMKRNDERTNAQDHSSNI